MSRLRIFVSSTYYDLKHIRASLDLFIESMGFEPVLSEKGSIAYTHTNPLDESCYREVNNSDMLILILGGRYGSPASDHDIDHDNKNFLTKYESVTRKEFETALNSNIPVFIAIEKSVYSEYSTYLRNKSNLNINYAHVDSVNIFHFIEQILSLKKNNPILTFDKFNEVESWLRDQWSGLFRELLKSKNTESQLTSLSTQIEELRENNRTLKTYLESVMKGENAPKKLELINSEEKRLRKVSRTLIERRNHWISYVFDEMDRKITKSDILDLIIESKSTDDYLRTLEDIATKHNMDKEIVAKIRYTLQNLTDAQKDINNVRIEFNKTPFEFIDKPLFN